MENCITCGRENKDKKRKKCGTCRVRTARKNTKLKAIEHMGGKCMKCGYNKSIRALQFHHLDPLQKDFQISGPGNIRWERVKEELKKCILVCSNCHAEIHEEIEQFKLI